MTRFFVFFAVFLAGCGQPNYEQIARNMDLPLDVTPVCGFEDVLGYRIDDIGGNDRKGCGITDPVKIYAVGLARMSVPARLNCSAVAAFRTWMTEGVQAEARAHRSYVSEVRVAASYSCRNRNNRKSGRLSEHAKGNAIDISALTLANGDEMTILKNYRSGEFAPMLQRLRKVACGPFGTVLGPGSDRHHNDHFHFDVASYRNGPYCR